MHRSVAERRTKQLEEAVWRYNEKTHVYAANFSVRDYVLVEKIVSREEN